MVKSTACSYREPEFSQGPHGGPLLSVTLVTDLMPFSDSVGSAHSFSPVDKTLIHIK